MTRNNIAVNTANKRQRYADKGWCRIEVNVPEKHRSLFKTLEYLSRDNESLTDRALLQKALKEEGVL